MRYLYLVILILLLSATTSYSQNLLKGRVFELKTHIAIGGVKVENQATQQSVVTDNSGNFSIKAKLNDVLVFTVYSYKPDTIVVTNFNAREVYLQPQVLNLKEVTVRQSQDVKMAIPRDPDFHGQTMNYQIDPKTGYYKGGVNARLHWDHSEEKKRQKEENLQHSDVVEDQITKIFTPETVGKYVPLKGQELADFIEMYRPTAKVYTALGFNLTVYLNNCYKEYQQLPPEKRHPVKLNG